MRLVNISMEQNKDEGWHEWSKHVLYQLESSKSDHEKMREDIKKLQDETLTMRVQAGMIGAGASIIVGVLIKLIK